MWLFLALLCAFLVATTAFLSKVLLARNDEYLVAWLRMAASSPFLFLLLFFIKRPQLDAGFFIAVILLLPIEITAYLLYIKAIKGSPLSLTMPFLSLTPVVVIFSGELLLGEKIDIFGVLGILTVVAGAYMLNIERVSAGILEPFRSIYREKGCMLMIVVALLYSITAPLGKFAIQHSSALFFTAIYYPLLAACLTPIALVRAKRRSIRVSLSKKDIFIVVMIGLLFAVSAFSHFLGLTMTKAAYMITAKRMSMAFAAIYGWLFFKEKNIGNRLLGMAFMIAGIILISLS
jgi:drug/metabolite transporter (DMT)-like permease